ncbi:MAG: adenosylcobinamide-GDP ribazoletransferase [Mycobacteriaceae bacterium]
MSLLAKTGISTAFSWLTIIPVDSTEPISRATAQRAIAATPLVGIALGLICMGILFALKGFGLSATLSGLLAVGFLALSTRGMHIDGLSDTADGLGCYGNPLRAQEVMHSGSIGPFGAASLVFTLTSQAISLGVLSTQGSWWTIMLAIWASRITPIISCRKGIKAANTNGFGALVAETQTLWACLLWIVPTLCVSALLYANHFWYGPLIIVLSLSVAELFTRHCARRLGGVSGDVLGANIEISLTLMLITFTLL